MDGWMDGWIDGQTEIIDGRLVIEWKDREIDDGWLMEIIDGRLVGWMDRQRAGWMDGWIDRQKRWMDGWRDKCVKLWSVEQLRYHYIWLHSCKSIHPVYVLVLANEVLFAKYIAVLSPLQQIDYLISNYDTVKHYVLYDLESKYAIGHGSGMEGVSDLRTHVVVFHQM